MAYYLTEEERAVFSAPYPQKCVIELTPAGGDPMTIDEKSIVQGSMGISRYSVSGDTLELGSMISAEFGFTLNNHDGAFDSITFEGASMFVSIKSASETTEVTMPMGYFTIDEAPRKLKTINVVGLDRMVQFDKPADASEFTFPCSIADIVDRCCEICNVPKNVTWKSITNYGLSVEAFPEDSQEITYRQLLQWCGELMGAFGYIDYNGEFRLVYYGGDSQATLTTGNRTESDLADDDVVITGVSIEDSENCYVYGEEGYTLNISSNPLLSDGARDTVGANLQAIYQGMTYRPFTATILPMPWLYPGDTVTFVDGNGTEHTSFVTKVDFALNSLLRIESDGKSATKAGYATANPLTNKEAAIIRGVQASMTQELNDRVQSIAHLSEIAANSLGYYTTNVEQADGSTISYMHNKATLGESSVIYKITADGFFVSTDGGETYDRGFDKDGNAVVNVLSAIGIQADWVDINGIIDRINSEDGTQSINGTKVAIDGMGLDVVMTSVTETAKTQQESITSLQGTAEGLRLDVTKNQSDIAGVEGDVSTINSNLNEYFEFATEGLRIGRAGSPFSTLYAEDGMIIQSGGVDTAYFRNAEMQITRANVLESMQIGKFKFIPRTNGNLSFRYVGGGS